MTVRNASIFDEIESLDNAAKIPALRAIVHSTMARCIGAIRQDINERAREARKDEADIGLNDLDQRNGQDENNRTPYETAIAMGFNVVMPPLKLASILHAVYEYANDELHTIATSTWDQPLNLDGMIKAMATNSQSLDATIVKALAEAIGCDEATIKQMHELQSQKERERLIEAKPEIIDMFHSLGDNGYASAIDELPTLVQHQLGVKIIDSLVKAQNSMLIRIMRTKRLTDLATIPLLKEGVTKISAWVHSFEEANRDELAAAHEAGRTVRSVEDVIPR